VKGRNRYKTDALAAAVSLLLLIAGGAAAETVTLTVHDYSTGDGPSNLASNGVPFGPGVLFDEANLKLTDGAVEVPVAVRVLARWHGDNSIRALLLQFDADFGGATKNYTLHVGEPRSASDIPVTDVIWDFPKKIFTLPATYLCNSKVMWEQPPLGSSGFAAWEQKQLSSYGSIQYDGSLATCANSDQYYNSIHSSYQLYARAGDVEYLVNGRKWSLHHARDQIYLSGDRIGHGICSQWTKTRYTYVQGLVDDYFLWGDEEPLGVAGLIADNFYMNHPDKYYYLAPGERDGLWTEREPAFALLGLVTFYEATNNVMYLDRAKERVDALHRMQSDNGGTAWVHSLYDHDPSECGSVNDWGVSPWMSGLLMEGIIKYHKLTDYGVARQSIIWALDYLKDNCMATAAHAGESFIYLCGCDSDPRTDGVPDLDNLLSHAFAYGYTLTGSTEYKNVATNLVNTAVDEGWAGSEKHFNQQFRSSGHAIAYLASEVATLLAGFSASYQGPGIDINWHLSEEGIDMQFFVLRKQEPSDYFVDLNAANIGSNGMSYGFTDEDVVPGATYRYRVDVLDEEGRRTLFEAGPITVPAPEVALQKIYPNPFNPHTSISYVIPQAGPVTLGVYDARGRRVRTLVSGIQPRGEHVQTWNGLNDNGSSVASGVYYVRLESQGRVRTQKAVLLR
jgi:hypothetical protein